MKRVSSGSMCACPWGQNRRASWWLCGGPATRRRPWAPRPCWRRRAMRAYNRPADEHNGPKDHRMATAENARGLIAVDKMGGKVLFLNPATYATEVAIDGFPRTVHELLVMPESRLAYVPIFGDGIHGRNPNPGHLIAVIDLTKRAHVGDIDLRPYIAPPPPRPLAGIAISGDDRTVIAVDDEEPTLFLIDTTRESVVATVPLHGVAQAAQIARYTPVFSLLGVTSLKSDTVSLIDPSFREQTAITVGSQPMDMAFRGNELFVACQGDGSVHVIDIPAARVKHRFQAGTGCESLGFF